MMTKLVLVIVVTVMSLFPSPLHDGIGPKECEPWDIDCVIDNMHVDAPLKWGVGPLNDNLILTVGPLQSNPPLDDVYPVMAYNLPTWLMPIILVDFTFLTKKPIEPFIPLDKYKPATTAEPPPLFMPPLVPNPPVTYPGVPMNPTTQMQVSPS